MVITVTVPVATPTNLQATLQAGGSLDADTTYYYIVFGYDGTAYAPSNNSRFCFHSDISAEDSFTTTSENKSVLINWDNSVGATRYQILLTTVSGDYTNSGGYGTSREAVGNITDGVAGYTITSLSVEIYIVHSIQQVNTLIGDIDQSLGILKIEFTDTGTYDIDDIYDAVVNAGLSDYINYDTTRFITKGWWVGSGGCTVVIERKSLVFIKGGVHVGHPDHVFRFGRFIDDIALANYIYGCYIDIQNSRYPFRSAYSGGIEMYGCFVTSIYTLKTEFAENKSNSYYTGGAQIYISSYVDEMKDSILGMSGRSNSGDIVDLKWGQGNNWPNGKQIRLNIRAGANMPYTTGGKFYACSFNTAGPIGNYTFPDKRLHYTDFYDCVFPYYTDGIVQNPHFYYSNMLIANDYLSDNYYDFNFTLKFLVIDEDSNPLEDANISVTDVNGDPVTWIEQDGTFDKLATGNTFTTDRTTDSDGIVDYYVKSYKVTLNQENTDNPTSYDIVNTNSYPFNITISKVGYKSYTLDTFDITTKTELEVVLPTLTSETPEGISTSISEDSVSLSITEEDSTISISEDSLTSDTEEDSLTETISEDTINNEVN